MTRHLQLADVVDLEAQLARDAGQAADALHRRDRALAAAADGADRRGVVGAWLAALRGTEAGRDLPGRRVAGALRAVTALLVAAGLVVGWSAATVVLGYDGSRPVNVWDVLLVLVGVQLALLALLLASFAAPVASLGVPLLGLGRWLVRGLWRGLALRAPGAEGRRRELEELVARLRARQRLYGPLETWTLFGLTQAFGVAFNLGALAAFLRLVTFTDLAFGWSTTLDLDAAAFQHLAATLAAPWAGLVPDAVPGPDLVEATRWSRLAGGFVGAAGAATGERAGGWWRFLVLAVVTYGLVPRLCTLTLASLRRRWLLARLPLDDVEVQGLVDRLTTPVVSTRAPGAEAAPEPRDRPARVPRSPRGQGGSCLLVRWRDVPGPGLEAAAASALGRSVRAVLDAGGRRGPAIAEVTGAATAALRGDDLVVVACEAWEAPDAAALELVAALRRAAGERRWIVVLLVGASGVAPTGAEQDLWSRRLASLADPYTALEPLERAP